MIGWRPFSNDPDCASARLRSFLPLRYLAESGRPAEIFDAAQVDRYRTVVFQKAYTVEDVALARDLARRGVRIVFDLCDNHFLAAVEVDAGKDERLRAMIELADVVTASTSELARRIKASRVEVVDDALEELDPHATAPIGARFASFVSRRCGRARLVWFGNSGKRVPAFGLVDLERIVPELNELHRTRPIALTVMTDSHSLTREHLARAEFPFRFQRWSRTTCSPVLALHDVCLLPIETNEFTACKSPNRLLTALQSGCAVLADVIPSYEPFRDAFVSGCTAANLRAYLDDPARRLRDVERGRALIAKRSGRAQVVRQWSRVLDSVETSLSAR